MESDKPLGGYQRLDRAVARAEGVLAVVVLLGMVVVASAQALFFNIAERGVGWAQGALEQLSWADAFLQKGTLWLAFLGASLATYQDKHIAIDVLTKIAPRRVAAMMRAFASLGAGIIAFVLAYVFFQACLVADAAVPFEYEVLTPEGPAHVCDATASALGSVDRPDFLCALRAGLASFGIPVSSGSGIAQLIAPLMLLFIGVRLLVRAGEMAMVVARNDELPGRRDEDSSGTSDGETANGDDQRKGSRTDSSESDTDETTKEQGSESREPGDAPEDDEASKPSGNDEPDEQGSKGGGA